MKKIKNKKLTTKEKVMKGYKAYCGVVATTALIMCSSVHAFAAPTMDPMTVLTNLSEFIFGMIRALGMIMLGFGIVQVGLSLKSHDPSQRANGLMTLAGGIIITFTKEILLLITGG